MSWALIASAGLSAIGKIGGSIYNYSALREEGGDILHQADIFLQEAKREASLIREDGRKFAAEQSLQYIGAGFELGASALLTMQETRKMANDEADALVRRAEEKYSLAEKQKDRLKKEGQIGIVSSIFSTGKNILPLIKIDNKKDDDGDSKDSKKGRK